MPTNNIHDRAMGAIMGAFIGDALGLGPHWYYDLNELRHDYGDWIGDYTDPKPNRYHAGCKAGQLSQAGFILTLTLRSLVECGDYNQDDFCRRIDEELFPLLDGTPVSGPGATPASRFVKHGDVACSRNYRGDKPAVMQIRPRRLSVHLR